MVKILLVALILAPAAAVEVEEGNAANPVRKVVTMLQMMMNKIEAEGKRDEEIFDKFMCYCKTADETLGASLAEAATKIPQLESDIKEAEASKAQLEADLEQHQVDRDSAKEAISKATAIREKEAAEFAKESSEDKSNIEAISKAVAALEKGMAGTFLQTTAASMLKKLAESKVVMLDVDREELMSFLSGTQTEGYAPKSGEITGILKQMGDEMNKDLAEAIAAENAAIQSFEALVAAKKKEIASLTKSIEEKLRRVGELGVEIVTMKNDLEDTSEGAAEDAVFLQDLKKNCAVKKQEWEVVCKTRSEELLALTETIKILNDDDALELFKKTLPSASFMQIQVTQGAVRARALAALKGSSSKNPQMDFILLALQGKKVGFEKVIKLIDNMVINLGKEQTEDDHKKEYCQIQLDTTDDTKKALERTISDTEKVIAETVEAVATTKDEVAALEEGIKALDKQVAEATEQRKEENAAYTDLMASNGAAKELIAFAKNRMQKFYNPKLYKAPPKRELSEEERITLNMGGTLAPTNPPAGIAGTGIGLAQVSVHSDIAVKDAPAPPPEAVAAYSKKSEESGGVLAMMDMLVQDIDKEMTEAEMEEKDSQGDYEKLMSDSTEKRATDSKSITEKEGALAEMESSLQASNEAKTASETELMATNQYIQSLHTECDFLLEYYQVRKDARAGEIDAMKKAKAVLNGADYALVQTGRFLARATARCGPNTKLEFSTGENAAGTPIFQDAGAISDGVCISQGVSNIKRVKFCGPGTLTLSRMSCGKHDYKAKSVEHSKSEYTTQCEEIDAAGTVVDGYFGGAVVAC